jgi:hypothetical protein
VSRLFSHDENPTDIDTAPLQRGEHATAAQHALEPSAPCSSANAPRLIASIGLTNSEGTKRHANHQDTGVFNCGVS